MKVDQPFKIKSKEKNFGNVGYGGNYQQFKTTYNCRKIRFGLQLLGICSLNNYFQMAKYFLAHLGLTSSAIKT